MWLGEEAERDEREDAAACVGILKLPARSVRGVQEIFFPQEQRQENHAGRHTYTLTHSLYQLSISPINTHTHSLFLSLYQSSIYLSLP